MLFLGIDIGGTNTKFGVMDENYRIIKKDSIETGAKRSADEILADIIKKADELCHEYEIEAVGIGAAGRVDATRGVLERASNLPFSDTPIAEIVSNALGKQATLSNDARAAVCGELYAGAGRRYNTFAMITLGTGVGGGIVIDKKMYLGKFGGAGEFGHVTVDMNGEKCRCGQVGCLEHYASVTALIRQTEEAVKDHPESTLARLSEGGATGRTAFDAMRAGCPVGSAVVDKYIEYVATGATNVARVLQPDAIVIGGAISNEGDTLILPLRAKFKQRCDVVASELKNDAGIIGAVAMLREANP